MVDIDLVVKHSFIFRFTFSKWGDVIGVFCFLGQWRLTHSQIFKHDDNSYNVIRLNNPLSANNRYVSDRQCII